MFPTFSLIGFLLLYGAVFSFTVSSEVGPRSDGKGRPSRFFAVAALVDRYHLWGAVGWWIWGCRRRRSTFIRLVPQAVGFLLWQLFVSAIGGFLLILGFLVPFASIIAAFVPESSSGDGNLWRIFAVSGVLGAAVRIFHLYYVARAHHVDRSARFFPILTVSPSTASGRERTEMAAAICKHRFLLFAAVGAGSISVSGALEVGSEAVAPYWPWVFLIGIASTLLTASIIVYLINRKYTKTRALIGIYQCLQPSQREDEKRGLIGGFPDPLASRRRALAKAPVLLGEAAWKLDAAIARSGPNPCSTLLLASAREIREFSSNMPSIVTELPKELVQQLELTAAMLHRGQPFSVYQTLNNQTRAFDTAGRPDTSLRASAPNRWKMVDHIVNSLELANRTVKALGALAAVGIAVYLSVIGKTGVEALF